MRTLFKLTGAVLLSTSAVVAGVGTALPASAGSDYKIAFFSDSDDNAWVQAGIKAGEDTAKKAGVDIEVFSAGWDASKQLTQIQDAIASGEFDAYVVEAIDGQTVCKAVKEAAEDSVVSIYNTPICGDVKKLYTPGTIGYFGRDEYKGGKLLGEELGKAVGGKGKVAYISGPEANSIVQTTTAGFKAGLKKYPDVELVAELPGDWDAAKGLSATQDLLEAHPDIDGIAYGVDQMMVPSLKWLKDNDKLGDIKIVTEGGSTDAFEFIKSGEVVAAVAGLPYTEAANGTQAAIDVLEGKKISVKGFDAKKKIADYLKDPIFDGKPPVITKANVDSFEAEWSAA